MQGGRTGPATPPGTVNNVEPQATAAAPPPPAIFHYVRLIPLRLSITSTRTSATRIPAEHHSEGKNRVNIVGEGATMSVSKTTFEVC